MFNSIPASKIVSINPQVLATGGSGLDLVGMILTDNTSAPAGLVLTFSGPSEVSDYFGPTAKETRMAQRYFMGFTGAATRPAALSFYGWAVAARTGWLRGSSIADIPLATLKALSGTLTVTVGGTQFDSANIDLSAATSFSNAASIIQTAFTSPTFNVTYSSVARAFIFETNTDGAAATITHATGTLAAPLRLSASTGALLSQGSDPVAAGNVMDGVIQNTQNFATFTTSFLVNVDQGLALAEWNNRQNSRYAYILLDTSVAATTSSPSAAVGYQVIMAGYEGTVPLYGSEDRDQHAFVMAYPASLDFNQANGDTNAAFRSQTGIIPDVTTAARSSQLEANGYNYVGAWGTANDEFRFLYSGTVTGPFMWLDAYVNQIWMNNELQLTLMGLLTSAPSIPYNGDGYAMIEAAMMGPINAALNFGAIRAGVALSDSQRLDINSQAGVNAADAVEDRGWFILIGEAAPEVRTARGSPPITLWYTDGGSVNRINVNSVEVQ